jgi:carbonic anhydrase
MSFTPRSGALLLAALLGSTATAARAQHSHPGAPAQRAEQPHAEPARPAGPPAAPAHEPAAAEHAWGYQGATGPEHWGDLKPEYAVCKTGRKQSPINITGPLERDGTPLRFHYQSSPLKVVNNGHTIQVNYAPGSAVELGSDWFQLLQFHFHTPSEERVNGRAYEMVGHLVHRNQRGQLAVVAVLLTVGKENRLLRTVWEHLPMSEGPEQLVESAEVDVSELLPRNREKYYGFTGSLTTPPCTEGVRWLVLKTPVEMSRAQWNTFRRVFPHNARPVQPLYGRVLYGG